MTEINALALESELRSTFRRYLFSANGIAENEPELREAFWEALSRDGAFCRPTLLSAIPSYRLADPPSQLIRSSTPPRLHARLAALNEGGFSLARPLYSHQIASIGRIQSGRNLIVASGTGSGKTECFLLPILDDALRNPGPGVRAIIVYPLNALANDQLKRLRLILRDLPEITYGRYTGETPYERSELSAEDLADLGGENERATRQEIRQQPPHILLTNFAMLEYLLLRPADADVFRHRRVQFIVLDEAHSYQGSQGIDVGYLMRRLAHVRSTGDLQYILTSATLGDDFKAIASFGAALTGGRFEPADVVTGDIVSGFSSAGDGLALDRYVKAVPDEEALDSWARRLSDANWVSEQLKGTGILAESPKTADVRRILFETFRSNADLARIHEALSERPSTAASVAHQLWGRDDPEAVRVVHWLVLLGANAVGEPDAPPLVPARHHIFFKGLQAASVCVSAKCSARLSPATAWSHLMLQDRQHCEHCEARVLPLLTCVHCGVPVLRIYQPNGRSEWKGRPGLPNSSRAHLLTWRDIAGESDDDTPDGERAAAARARLCVSCGWFSVGSDNEDSCACGNQHRVSLFVLDGGSPEGALRKCPNCRGEARQFPSVLREFGTGEDAATAVLAESMLRLLPEESKHRPADGRRLLVFSDSRQRAAYFAPYLQRTTGETQVMAPLLAAIERALGADPDGAPFSEVAFHFARLVERQPFVIVRHALDDEGEEFGVAIKNAGGLIAADRASLRRDSQVALLRHFISQGRRRDTLPGLALAALRIDLTRDARDDLARLARDLQLPEEATESLLQYLLGTIVRRRALELPDGITARMLGPGPQQTTMHRTEAGSVQGRTRIRWDAFHARTNVDAVVSRSPQVAAIAALLNLEPLQQPDPVKNALAVIWEWMRDRVFRQIAPNEYVIPTDALTVIRPSEWRICERCGVTSAWAPVEKCLMPRCGGVLRPLCADDSARWARSHQRSRFVDSGPLPVHVKEHTAQLTLQAGRDYQRRFMTGEINVLSSSTTFEMGIDVGQLRAILLRNVPPTPANYIQRAGRAGRRREGNAFSITYARTVPHDQTHFHAAEEITSGTVAVPRIRIENGRLAQRHVNSLLLGSYLTEAGLKDDSINVGTVFESPEPTDSPAAKFQPWLAQRASKLLPSIQSILPDPGDLKAENALEAAGIGMEQIRTVVADELRSFRNREAELIQAIQGDDPQRVARALSATRGLLKDYLETRLIDFLASEHWLPSYAFPQDVVRLRVVEPRYTGTFRLDRDAEYGIAEYAPGAEVIADGKLISSSAIDFRGRTADVRHYRICRHCHNVAVDLDAVAPPAACPVCGVTPPGPLSRPRAFVVPPGFSSSLDKPVAEVRLSRLKAQRTSEVFLVSGVAPAGFVEHAQLKGITLGYRPDGELFRANSGTDGTGFRVCLKCGTHITKAGPHRNPYGIPCGGQIKVIDLAYRFRTDTLQIRFDGVTPHPPSISDLSFWLSLQTAILAAAGDVLKIPPRDLEGTYRAQDAGGARGEVVIYDRVPGGAGYVNRISAELPAVLGATLDRVKSCLNAQCDPEASCYACLRSYHNQFYWDQLKRSAVVGWLETILLREPPRNNH